MAPLRAAPDAAQDSKGRSGGNTAGPSNHDYGSRRPGIARDHERQGRAAQRKINQVTRQTVCRALDWSTRALRTLDSFDNAPQSNVAAYFVGADLQHS
jgi:hypothetical protein